MTEEEKQIERRIREAAIKLKKAGVFVEFAHSYIAFFPETPEQMKAILGAEKELGMTGKDSDLHGQRYWLFQREPESFKIN
jgi:hypothetical protein